MAQNCPKIERKHEKIRGVRGSGPKRQTVITEKTKIRKQLILDFVKDCNVVDDAVKIYKFVNSSQSEAEKRVEFGTMDRKYFRKLLDKMNEDKEIKIIPIKVGTGQKTKELKFVCMPHISETDPIIKTYLDQQKMKLNFSPVEDGAQKK